MEAYDLQMRTFAYKERLCAFEMEPVFQVITSFDTTGYINGSPLGLPVNVLDNPAGVSIDQIRKSNKFYRTFGQDATVLQDLDWSAALIENSSAETLRNQMFERLIDVPASERGGPLLYKIMMDIVTTIRPEAIENLLRTLRSLTLQHEAFPGEDVDRVNQLIRGTVNRLAMIGAVPHDIYRLVCVIYQTSTTPEFVAKFQLLANLNELGQSSSVASYTALLAKGEEEYRAHNACETWCAASKRGKGPKDAAFMGAAGDGATIKCHRCGKEGHMAKECRAKISGGGSGKDNNPLRIAPKATDPQTKSFTHKDGTTSERKWCSKCNLWNVNHFTTGHQTKAEMAAAAAAKASGLSASIVKVTLCPPDLPVTAPNEAAVAAAHAAQALMAGLLQPSV
jgi:hypothetical protein